MTINIPGYLQWVSYLTGSEWPQGDEDAMRRIADCWRDAAGDLSDLVPDLNRVRSETMSVLMGETADAAEQQFAMLFDGDYSVDKLAEAMSALGELAGGAGTEIEYTKLQILTSLAIAAAEIAWALAAAPETFGASTALIPVTEAATIMTVRQLVAMLLRQLVSKLSQALTKTAVRRLLREMGKEALQETVVGLGQELAIQGYQVAQGNRDGIDWDQARNVGISSAVGGAAAAPVHTGTSRLLGDANSMASGITKGAISGYTAGVAGNVAGTLATGGQLDALSIFGGAASSAATGGVHGGKGHGGTTDTGARPDAGGPDSNGAAPSRNGSSSYDAGGSTSNGQQSHNGSSQTSSNTTTSNSESGPDSHAGVSGAQDGTAGSPHATSSSDPSSHTAASSAPAGPGDSGAQDSGPTHSGGDGGPSGPSDSAHAADGPDGGGSRSDGKSDPVGPQDHSSQSNHTQTDTAQQPHDNGQHSGDTRQSGNTHDPAAPHSDTATHAPAATEHSTTQEHSTPQAVSSTPSAAGASSSMSTPAATSSAPTGTPAASTSTSTSSSTTPGPTTPTTTTPTSSARPSLSGTSTAASQTKPAGAPAARVSDAAATTSETGQQHDPTADSTIPPVAVAPVLPTAGGDSTPSRGATGQAGPAQPRVTTSEAQGVSRTDRPGATPGNGPDNQHGGPSDAGSTPDGPATHGPVGNPSDARIFGPGELTNVEDPAHQTAVENALRNPDGSYAVHADPRTNAYGDLINDGGTEVDGRRNNCLDCSLSALSSFIGDPTVSAPRFPDEVAPGVIDDVTGEQGGLQRAENWLGGGLLEFPSEVRSAQFPSDPTPNQSINDAMARQFAALHEYVAGLGPGSAALVVNGWHGTDEATGAFLYNQDGTPVNDGSHATVIVYPEGANTPVWWDPQQGLTSDHPPAWMVGASTYLHFTPIDPPQGVHNAGTGNQGTSSGLPGRNVTDGDVSRVPVRARMGMYEGADPAAGEFGSNGRDGAVGDRLADGERVRVSEPAGADGGRDAFRGQADGAQQGGRTDLPASVENHDGQDSGGRRDGRVSDDSGVADRSSRTEPTLSDDHQQADVSRSTARTTDETGDGARGIAESSESRSLAGNGRDHSLAGSSDGSDRIGAPHDSPDDPPRDASDHNEHRAQQNDAAAQHYSHEVGQIIDVLANLRTDADNGQTHDVHEAAQQVRDHWNNLSQAQRDAVIAHEIQTGHRTKLGDLDGLPAEVRDKLNRHNLVEDMAAGHPDGETDIRRLAQQMQDHLADPAENVRPAPIGSDQLKPSRLKRLASLFSGDAETRSRTRNADAAWDAVYGYPENGKPRQLYTYDPMAFNGDGRIAVVVGNLDTAAAVAVHIPGITTTIRSAELNVNNAENHYLRAQYEQRDVETAVVSWIGYDAPSGNVVKLGRETATQAFAEAGGHRLAHDVAGIVGSRTESPDVHLFGHSYGSTTTAHAGVDGRLADYVSTVTLLGSPGAGPLTHASDFGIGADNVYVASASRDVVTWTGSHYGGVPNRGAAFLQNFSAQTFVAALNHFGPLTNVAMGVSDLAHRAFTRMSGIGQGIDPALRDFGANRLTAQYRSPEHLGGINPHTRYFATEQIGSDGDPVLLRDGPHAPVTESLDNFSHILTGNADSLSFEADHRGPEHIFGDPARTRAVEPVPGYPANNCVPEAIEGFRNRHPDTTVTDVETDHGNRGVPRSDYEQALGSGLRDATLDDILAATQNGESVVVVDTYHAEGLPAGHPGSHTYAVEPNPDDPENPHVYEGNERTPRPWPPAGIDRASHTQIATFHPDGTPTHPLTENQAHPRDGDDQRIAGDHTDPTELPAHHRDADYSADHISNLLDLPAYHPGSLSDIEVRSVYLNGEQRMAALDESLRNQGVDAEARARTMFEARNELRSWARELMSDRDGADRLTRENPNHSWDDIVAKYRERGLDGDDLYHTIAERSMASRPSVNQQLGLDPDRPPPLPPMRDAPDPRIGAAHPHAEPAAAHPDTTHAGDAADPQDRPQHSEEHHVDFKEGTTPTTQDKSAEYERQIGRQIDGLNDMTANELIHNMDHVEREGTAQSEARTQYREALLEDEIENAFEMLDADPDALGDLTPAEYAANVVDETMALLAALHEPDLVAGGDDVISNGSDGRPSMGDRHVNSSIGSQWRHRVEALRAYAQTMIDDGHGDERLNVTWSLSQRT
ncbi:alpha/beta hydrolase [Mycobacterium sp. ST-F2]|uniref:alpha/beta hydrolase n=1 Tax=Mycobacterium sp. ST-F2 TaxID=1490484 RepID=UPI00093C8BA1|nr:alpha/beta hydrolase [Mycobacterium sp. ST-F2]